MPESHLTDDMKAAIRRAAERELELILGDKPINDMQIMGTAYDVHVEGTYLGWTSAQGKVEAQEIYDATSSRLRHEVERTPQADPELSMQVGLALKRCRQIEADLVCGKRDVAVAFGDLRSRLEVLHESALMADQNGKRL